MLAVLFFIFLINCGGIEAQNIFEKWWTTARDWATGVADSVQQTIKEVDDWDCGADKFWITKYITQKAAQNRCRSVIEEINRACRYHDFCYSNGIDGQEICDDRFCETLLSISIKDPIEREQCSLPRTMCEAVRAAGNIIYRDKSRIEQNY